MFKNYYSILNIQESASILEIKSAFKKQAVLWHPDKNPGKDTTKQMQDIIEAKLILLDQDARTKYDYEYQIFKHQFQHSTILKTPSDTQNTANNKNYYEHNVQDDILKRWMDNAQRQAESLLKQTIEDFKGMVMAGGQAGLKAAGNQFAVQISIAIIGILIMVISRSCN